MSDQTDLKPGEIPILHASVVITSFSLLVALGLWIHELRSRRYTAAAQVLGIGHELEV